MEFTYGDDKRPETGAAGVAEPPFKKEMFTMAETASIYLVFCAERRSITLSSNDASEAARDTLSVSIY
jgi:hypothetical protein